MPELVERLTVFAPAKVNLHLCAGDRRQDGFHSIESVFLAVDFGDTLYFERISPANSVEIVMDWKNSPSLADSGLSMEKNIIFRALSLFRAKTGFDTGLKISVEKRIPCGGGLGGGSSDAAAALLALNKLAGRPLSRETLLEMGASLGSDVPFFVSETGCAWVSGRGEVIRPLKAPPLFLTLVNPGFPSDTAAAYRLLDEYREKKERRDTQSCTLEEERVIDFSQAAVLPQEPSEWPFFNDFLPVFNEPEKSAYQKIIFSLKELGAGFSGLSGSGSTCFGVFKEKAAAQEAAAQLRASWNFVECCSPRDRQSL
jgi:4-diphosphocytidyl-2-C-methyl-D-erythritol kinase